MSQRSIRFQLLVAVNGSMALLFGVFLLVDYRRELAERLAERQVQMEEEAQVIAEAVLALRHHGEDSVQKYIDAVCGRMREADSPGHHIAVRWKSTVMQAVTHQRASPEMLEAMLWAARSPLHRARINHQEIVAGSYEQNGLTVFVSEYLANLRRAALADMLRRFGGIWPSGCWRRPSPTWFSCASSPSPCGSPHQNEKSLLPRIESSIRVSRISWLRSGSVRWISLQASFLVRPSLITMSPLISTLKITWPVALPFQPTVEKKVMSWPKYAECPHPP